MQLIDATHQRQLAVGNRLGLVIHRPPADAQQLGLALDRQLMSALDHRFALSKPALLSAPCKKSFSSVNCPILACSSFRSTGGVSGAAAPPKTPAARSINWRRHSVT